MRELIEKLEAAAKGSRELDANIADAIGVKSRSRRTWSGENKGREWFVDSVGGVQTWSRNPPAYTTSLDAALTLVPEGYDVELGKYVDDEGPVGCFCRVSRSSIGDGPRWEMDNVQARTLPLALCIAAFKAREAQT